MIRAIRVLLKTLVVMIATCVSLAMRTSRDPAVQSTRWCSHAIAAYAAVQKRRALRYLLASFALLGALVTYCELCSVVNGLPAPGLAVSGPWAIKLSLGWIIIGAAIGTFGARVAKSRMASAHPRAFALGAVLLVAVFALLCETFVLLAQGDELRLLAFIYQRAPVSIAASAVLIAIYIGNRALRPTDLIDVMTGTGRVTIQVAEIECLQADGNYINIMHASGRIYLLRQTMVATESSLDPGRFVRIHRSTIVNRLMIKERRRGGMLVLQSGRTVSIGRAFRHRL